MSFNTSKCDRSFRFFLVILGFITTNLLPQINKYLLKLKNKTFQQSLVFFIICLASGDKFFLLIVTLLQGAPPSAQAHRRHIIPLIQQKISRAGKANTNINHSSKKQLELT